MRIIISLIKLVGGLFLLTVPVILAYWILSTINLAPLQFITSMLESLLKPFLVFVQGFTGEKAFPVGGLTVNLVPIFLSVVCFVIYLAFLLVAHLLSMFDSSVSFVSAKSKLAYTEKQRTDSKKDEEKRLLEKNTGYVVINFKQQTTSSAYLTSSGLTKEDILNKFMDLVSKYQLLDAEKLSDSTEGQLMLMFQEVAPSVSYVLSLQENVQVLNKQLDKAGVRLLVNIGMYCAGKNESVVHSSKITVKVSNLAAPGEVACSRDVKEIYEKVNVHGFVKFVSKGMYDLGGEIEIYTVKKKDG